MNGTRSWKEWAVIAIAAIAILSAVGQVMASANVLILMGLNTSFEGIYWLRLASLFSGFFGGMLLHSQLSGRDEPTILLWAGLEKIAGAVAVGIGAVSGLLATAVLIVAIYDFMSGAFLLWMWREEVAL